MRTPLSDKANSLLALIRNGLRLHSEQATALSLGDRSQYIGLSDIGRALECPRAALSGKISPRPQASLQKHLTLQRGHWLEYGIGQALAAHHLRILPQLELGFVHKGIPIKVHLDFALVWDRPRPAIRILELKSTEHLPETLYTSYEAQLYGQAGFLALLWNEPVFSLRDTNGALAHRNLTLPELCKSHFGLTMPLKSAAVDIEAWVLCISMSDAKPFGPYVPDATMSDLCLHTAEKLWQHKLAVENGNYGINSIAHATGFHALCAYCDWSADCPKFYDGEYQPEWQPELERLARLKNSRSALESQIEELENGLKDAYALSDMKGNWINTGSHRFRVTSTNGRRTLNRERLLEELSHPRENDKAENILTRCEQEGRAFSRLVINEIN